ncbi:GntR family transcriptional regulator [Alkalihalobacillus sp. 1P02AB]|uniref:GntR family transcriptional regulator n=1 Tax=Alkalihalobacillus sp. 1P02AB TaxID=3132260 RepID=UPI0039A53B5E
MSHPLNNIQKKPRYEIIYEEIKQKIMSKAYKIGDRIPTEKELIDYYNVSRITTKKALDQLVHDGLIERIAGKGTFVIGSEGHETPKLPKNTKGYIIGFVFPEIEEEHVTGLLIKSLNIAAREYSIDIVIKQTFGNIELEKEAIVSLLNLGVDGMIILPVSGEYFNEEVLKLTINKFPHVLVDRYFKGIQTTSICTDNANAAKNAVNYLFDKNHQQIAVFSPPYKDISAIEERVDGFIQAYAERGHMVNRNIWLTDLISELSSNKGNEELIERDIQVIKEHLLKYPEISAIFAVHYNIAVLVKIAADELNLLVPDDLSIICFDGQRKTRDRFRFTHIEQDQKEMGEKAIEALVALIEENNYPDKVTISTNLVEGESTKIKRVDRV